ncbi:MAG: hypothetical protein OXC95_00050 [Dehalococcoidia bacterium]|nr:hypothetical protein [Dehalococcoidia bacterium]
MAGMQSESYLTWLLFASLMVCGIGRMMQTRTIWMFGGGYPLIVTSASAFIAVCAAALVEGGPAMMATLIAISGILQLILISRLSVLRRIITPTVAGTVLMLMSAMIIFLVMDRLSDVPGDVPTFAAPVVAGATLAILAAIRLFGSSSWQQWAPVVAIVAGCGIAQWLGLYEFQSVIDAPWIGIPSNEWQGFDLSFGVEFWALLPGFVVVILATSINSISDTVAIQQVAWRRPRATDFRVVQNAHNMLAVTNLLSAFIGAMPNMIGGSNSARIILTGVASRRVAFYGGAIMVGAALLPKVLALVASIPRPVLVAYIFFLLLILFMQGMRIVVQDGLDGKKAMAVGLSLWLGIGFQNDMIFADLITGDLEMVLGNGMTIGSICIIVFTAIIDLVSYRRRRLTTRLSLSALANIDMFLREFAAKSGWNVESTERLCSAGEETLSSLLSEEDESQAADKRLTVNALRTDGAIELEFMVTSEGENLEDRLAYLRDLPEILDDREISFRLLRHYASSVQHRKYHDIDIVTVRVAASRS